MGERTAPQRKRARKRTNREHGRLERKRRLAAVQVEQFEDTLSGHELNLERLKGMPASLVGRSKAEREEHEQAIAAEEKSIRVLRHAIDHTSRVAGDALDAGDGDGEDEG